jgi:pimeloyl-ACP methyl ester carboxylesterase
MSDETPTVVLVHGAFADASSWNGVVELLQAKGLKVTAPANPLRGIAIDSAYIAGVLGQIPGPILAVGHSYGGAVLTNAATNAKNVVGLVYVAAFAPAEGEVLGEVTGGSKDSVLDTALVPAVPVGRLRRVGAGVRDRPRKVPRRLRRRPARRAVRGPGRDPAARCGGGVLRAVRPARMEAPALLGCRRVGRHSGGH